MTLPHSSHDPADEETASLWAARLDGDKLSPAALREFETWLSGHPARRALVSEYCQFSVDLGQLLHALSAAGSVTSAQAPVKHRHRWLPRLAVSGLAAAAACAAFLFWLSHTPRAATTEFATAPAQRHSLTLADGTLIDLSARTRVTIALGTAERRVQLASGQAFFAVAKDATKPFTVETPVGSVLVTGTKFAVRAEPDSGLEVLVSEGQVRVSPSAVAAPVTLGAGQRLTALGTQLAVEALPPEAIGDALAWRDGQIVFAGTPIGHALARFAHFHGRDISTSPEAANLRVGGRYNLDDLDGFLAALEEILPIQVTRAPNSAVQVDLRSAR